MPALLGLHVLLMTLAPNSRKAGKFLLWGGLSNGPGKSKIKGGKSQKKKKPNPKQSCIESSRELLFFFSLESNIDVQVVNFFPQKYILTQLRL